jgi:membrane protease YdiL (CAAX protease family)
MKHRFHLFPEDADLAAIRLERFVALLETVLLFSVYYLIQQLLAARGWFERMVEMPGTIGLVTTHQGWIVATLAGMFALPLLIRRITHGWRPADFGFAPMPPARDLILAVYLGGAMGLWFALGFVLRPAALHDARVLLAIDSWPGALFYIGYVAVLASALRNEFFFRGYVQQLLADEYGTSWGTLLALVYFWITVLWVGSTHLAAILLPLGLIAALLFNRQRSLYGPILFHALALGLGFLGYALMELTPRGYPFFTAALALVVLGLVGRMRPLLTALLREARDLVVGLESNWLRNSLALLAMVLLLLTLQWTARTNLQAHTGFTVLFALVFIAYKAGLRVFELRKLLEP